MHISYTWLQLKDIRNEEQFVFIDYPIQYIIHKYLIFSK